MGWVLKYQKREIDRSRSDCVLGGLKGYTSMEGGGAGIRPSYNKEAVVA